MSNARYTLLTSAKRISSMLSMHESTIRQAYISKQPKKTMHLKFLDIGTFLEENSVSIEELLIAIKAIREAKEEVIKRIKV